MHLLNMMIMCGDAGPVVVSICYCTYHTSEGGKRDATYFVEIFQEKVNEFDHDGRNIYRFFFDGASNVQKAGQILHQTFSRAYCFHGDKHVLSFFFRDLSKLKPNQVKVLIFL